MNCVKTPSYLSAIILLFKFIERCTFYTLKTVQTPYLSKQNIPSDSIKLIIHTLEIISYISPILGSMIYDMLTDKNKILMLSFAIYFPGLLLLTMKICPFMGLLMCNVSGGIVKPCVVAIGAGLFKNDCDVSTFMNRYYMVINYSCLITGIVVPLFENEEHVLFFDLVVLTIASLLYFFHSSLIGEKIRENKMVGEDGTFWIDFYNYVFPKDDSADNNELVDINCINNNTNNESERSGYSEKDDDSLIIENNIHEIADNPNNNLRKDKFINDIKQTAKNMIVFFPLTFMWALQSQKYSMWQDQAELMRNVEIFGKEVKPNSMLVLNPLFSIIMIYIFSQTLFASKMSYRAKMIVSAFLGSLGFCIAAFIQYKIYKFQINSPPFRKSQISILWQIPQYFFITCFEVISLVSTTDYAYRYSPMSTRPLVLACLYSSVAIGNLWVVLYLCLCPMNSFFGPVFAPVFGYLVYAGINFFIFMGCFMLNDCGQQIG